jgi:tRNA-specific 2-thiouridylase
VREIAKKNGLSTAEKKDSQGICFLGNISLADFLENYLPNKKGDVLNAQGEKIGEHRGAYFYTIGQRQGVGEIKHQKGNKIHKPVYVVEKDVKKNTVVVAEEGSVELIKERVSLGSVNLINDLDLKKNKIVMTRIRYRQPLVKAEISTFARVLRRDESTFARVLRRDEEKLVLELEFEKPQKFVAKGQSAVFYSKKGEMLGGGVIIE